MGLVSTFEIGVSEAVILGAVRQSMLVEKIDNGMTRFVGWRTGAQIHQKPLSPFRHKDVVPQEQIAVDEFEKCVDSGLAGAKLIATLDLVRDSQRCRGERVGGPLVTRSILAFFFAAHR
ncbi:hypothetical protein [Sphingobium sp.]|uniref:hypothetical protein n=1 Tax=Sphingobium sp. TaxID=1912891 RepID=UPI00257DF896|nr:hypothetical protein [Sphingobium sp.]